MRNADNRPRLPATVSNSFFESAAQFASISNKKDEKSVVLALNAPLG